MIVSRNTGHPDPVITSPVRPCHYCCDVECLPSMPLALNQVLMHSRVQVNPPSLPLVVVRMMTFSFYVVISLIEFIID